MLFPVLIVFLISTRTDSASTAPSFIAPFGTATVLLIIGLMQHKINRLVVDGDQFTYYNWLGRVSARFERSEVLDIRFEHKAGNQSLWIVTLANRKVEIPDGFAGVRPVMEDLIRTLPEATQPTAGTTED